MVDPEGIRGMHRYARNARKHGGVYAFLGANRTGLAMVIASGGPM